ncbi:MAG: hypothetical protein IJ121_00630 [Eubacterium sp.]|nr:hypothetical protein [Eubacterium sp.]
MKTGAFSKLVIRLVILAAVVAAAAGIILFARGRSSGKKEEVHTETFGTPELPVMWVRLGDRSVNPMYGYQSEQDLTSRRTSLTLLAADRQFGVQVDPYGKKITAIRYEITSLLDGAFVENGTVDGLTEAEGLFAADIHISTPILMDQEYAICFAVDMEDEDGENGRTVYYYTRIVQKTGTNLEAYLTFADRFYRACITKDDSVDIASYLESESGSVKNTYSDTTIKSSLDQVTWGDLEPELFEEAIPDVKEINVETASFVYDYIITATDADGNKEYYNVHDFYRLRTNQGEILLIDMDRTAEQIFDAAHVSYVDKQINLGVRNPDRLQYLVSAGQERVAFVSGSDLWLYGTEDAPATCVFTFRSEAEPDRRSENRNSHIRICSVTDDGEVTFVVYGYMAAGQHEGCTGVAVYHYSEEENQLTEKYFMSSALDPEVLSYSVEKLSYVNGQNQMYLFTGTQILCTDPEDGEASVVQDEVDDSCIGVSKDQQYIAWMDEMDSYASEGVTVLNTNNGSTRKISAPDGEKIQIIGFFNQDLVYGLARDEDITTDAVGNRTFGMYRICIEDPNGSLLKAYGANESFFTEETWDGENLELVLSRKNGNSFVPSGNDHIINNDTDSDQKIQPETTVNKRCGQQVLLPFAVSSDADTRVRGADLVVSDNLPQTVLEIPQSGKERYYVYAGGKLAEVVEDSNQALRSADEMRGIVVDHTQKYVYERGNWSGGNMIDLEKIPYDLLVPPMDAAAIQQIIGDEYAVLNYSGCSVESIRYQLSRGYAVAAKMTEKQNVLLIGYDIYENLWYYDPQKGEAKALGSEDAEKLFAEQGNLFVSYYKL